ncbi:MAG TPA: helix-turn-helix transcriptional regulator [Gemmataceae bacterium]|nr:helix-turn-helix transcriptional regulator [Gemmataceae bacterium]
MDPVIQVNNADLVAKIARLVKERGWNQEDFARHADLNRQTARQIMLMTGDRRLRNTTISACARALGLTVSELTDVPLDRLLSRMNNHQPEATADDAGLRRLYEQATQPELRGWMERNPERAKHLTEEEIDELLSLQGTGGPLTSMGVEHFVQVIERKRHLIEQVHAIAGTEYLDVLEKIVELMYDKIQPYRNRT